MSLSPTTHKELPVGSFPMALELKSREEREGECPLPERIAKLPKDHPERKRFEKGWEQKNIKWFDPLEKKKRVEEVSRGLGPGDIFLIKAVALLLFFVVLLVYSVNDYMNAVRQLRLDIRMEALYKGYAISDPQVNQITNVQTSLWLPSLDASLVVVRQLPPVQAEGVGRMGMRSYFAYLEAQGKPFDFEEAMDWLIESYR